MTRLARVGASLRRWRPWIAVTLSLLALAAVLVIVVRQREVVTDALAAASRAPWWLIALSILLPIVNWWVISVSFWVMNDRFARTGMGETSALIGSAWLLNFLPLRPGLVGRLAYHKKYNGIAVRDSVRVLIELTLLSGASMVVLVGLGLLGLWLELPDAAWWAIAGGGATVLTLFAFALRARSKRLWRWGAAGGLRVIDTLIWAARYAVVFAIVDSPLSFRDAALLAVVSQVVLLIPISGNGVGLREAAIGAVGALLPGVAVIAVGEATPESRAAVAAAADLVHRGFEILVAVPIGLSCSLWIGRRVGRSPASLAAETSQ